MSENDRARRLDDASNLQDALRSLGKVSETHRIGFVHDRLMSAIDDICKTHQNNGSATFNAAQMLILKDIAFAMIYILDPKTQVKQSFFKRLVSEFKEQSPLKQIGLVAGAMATIAAAAGGVYAGYQKAMPWIEATVLAKADKVQSKAAETGATAPRPLQPPASNAQTENSASK
jgi:hypothetical protein